jgi:hypothetical protein
MSGYIGTQPVPQATQSRDSFTATGGQTTFATAGYQPGYIDVYLNGVHLVDVTDYTATNGSDVVLASGASINDIVEVVAYSTFEVLNQTLTGTTTVDVLNVTGAFTSLGIDDNATSTAITLSSGGNVGIGTGSPIYAADIKTSGTNNGQLRVGGGATSATGLLLEQTNSGTTTANIQNSYYSTSASASLSIKSGYTTFHTGTSGTERMRIADAEVYVGHTGSTAPWAMSGSQYGINLMGSGGFIGAARANAEPLLLNRTGSDGAILNFRKDGTTVGSISSAFSSSIAIDGAANRSGLYLATSSLVPRYNASNIDATVDLGATSTRFKDLYLSGGVYLGGTGAANHLDDYEEGTWTVALASTGTQPTYNFTSTSGGGASYIKVGRMVTVFFDRYVNITVAGTGQAKITGLPFSSDLFSEYGGYSAVQFRASSAFGTSSYVTGYVDGNGILVEVGNGTTSAANWTTGTNIRFSGTVTYRTA